jgi:hypothetical protein
MSREALAPIDRLPLADVAAHVAALIQPDSPSDQVADLYQQTENAKRLLAHIIEVRNECLLEWLAANGNELPMGDTKLYAGKRTDEKLRDLHAALDSALRLSGGDVEVIEGLLSANALKPGACAAAFGDEWRAEHFEKRTSPKVEVKKLDTKFLPKKGSDK